MLSQRTKEIKNKYIFNNQFNGNKKLAFERDNFCCVICSITNKEHRLKFGRGLSIHHIDGKGSTLPKEQQNNNLDNLATVCSSCHRKIEFLDQKINGKILHPTNKQLGRWSYKFKYCIECKKTDRTHFAKGLCTLCYGRKMKKYKHGYYLKNREKYYEYQKKSKAKHKDNNIKIKIKYSFDN